MFCKTEATLILTDDEIHTIRALVRAAAWAFTDATSGERNPETLDANLSAFSWMVKLGKKGIIDLVNKVEKSHDELCHADAVSPDEIHRIAEDIRNVSSNLS